MELAGINKLTKPEHRWKFQGQEEQKEFGLNWSSFKWRNADVALGRFFSVDPLAEDYYYNSVYAFSENQVVNAVELEGLEKYCVSDGTMVAIIRPRENSEIRLLTRSYDPKFRAKLKSLGTEQARDLLNANSIKTYPNLDRLAGSFAVEYNAESIVGHREYGARIGTFVPQNSDKPVYILGSLVKGDKRSVDPNESDIFGTKLAAAVHTHGNHPYGPGTLRSDHVNDFSGGSQANNLMHLYGDINWVQDNNVPMYLANPAGQVKVYKPQVYKPGAEKGEIVYPGPLVYDPQTGVSGSYPAYDVNLIYDEDQWKRRQSKNTNIYVAQDGIRYEGVHKKRNAEEKKKKGIK